MATEANGGAGGKFRKKPFRRTQATPYDRPSIALRPTQFVGGAAERQNNGWLSKLVDPASRLITAGAQKLFSSVFRKRLLPPPPQPSSDETPEIVDMQPETTTNAGPSGTKEPVASKGNVLSRVSESCGVADLENILKQKTFTRSELDHLTALLMSRTVDNLVGNEKGSSEPNTSDEKAVHNRHEVLANHPANENGAGRVLNAAITTPVLRSKVLEDVASPAELAKAYMGSRPTRASPSVLGLQNEMAREELSSSYNPFFKPKSPATSLIQKPANEIGVSANGFMTPRHRGRSAIYSMARTPYSRPHPTEVFKVAETTTDPRGASSSSHNTTDIQQLNGSKRQVLKRRSSALESDIGFVGPIRRIRQKPNLLHYKALSQPVSGAPHPKHGSGVLADVTEMHSSIDRSANRRSSSLALDNDMHSARNKSVPSQSIETAQKIFQQLDKFSSKGKSPEKKFDIVGGSSSGKLTTDKRDGLARKSMNTDSLKILQTIEDNKESGLVDSSNAPDHSLQTSTMVESSCLKFVPSVEDGAEAGSPTKALDFMNPRSNYGHQQNKRAFQMSAHEDYLELDDDVHANGSVSTPIVKGVEGHELAESSAAICDNPRSAADSAVNPHVSEIKSSTISLDSNKEPLTDGFAAAQKFSGFSVPVGLSTSSSPETSTQAAMSYPLSTAEMNSAAEQTEKINEMIPISSNSEAPKEIKSELLSSATEASNEADGPDKTVKKRTLHFGDVSKSMEGGPSSMASSAKGSFSFGAQSNGATLSNGLSSTSSVTMGVSSPTQISSTPNFQSTVPASVSLSPLLPVSNGNAASTSSLGISAGTMFSTTTTGGLPNFGSSSQFSTSVSAPVFGSSFQFGSSGVPSTSSSALGSVEGTKISETAFSNATGGLFSVKPIGNTISSFNSSTSTSASGENQTAPSAIFSSQASSSAVALTSSMPNFSSQSASSPSSNVFGFSAPTSVNSSASLSSGSNPFIAGSAPVSSVGFPSVIAPVSSSSNTSSSLFGLQTSKPASPGSIFGTSSKYTGFNFGSAASGTSGASNSTPIMFGATSSSSAASISTPTVFGATSSTSAASNSAPIVFGATSSTSAASNSSPIVFGANSSSSSANSGMFSFGAGSSAPSVFSVSSAVASTPAPNTPFSSQPAFASSTSQPFASSISQPFAFGLTPPAGNNDRMSMEDSMAEDSVQVSTPAAPIFGQPISAPSSSFVFNGAAQSAGSPFQFSGQQNQFAPQSTPFQPSGSLEFNAGGAGSFSLGSGGVDKASRRIVRVKKQTRRK